MSDYDRVIDGVKPDPTTPEQEPSGRRTYIVHTCECGKQLGRGDAGEWLCVEHGELQPQAVEVVTTAVIPVADHELVVKELREALTFTRSDISRRMKGDETIDAPFDEDLAEALQRIDAALARSALARTGGQDG